MGIGQDRRLEGNCIPQKVWVILSWTFAHQPLCQAFFGGWGWVCKISWAEWGTPSGGPLQSDTSETDWNLTGTQNGQRQQHRWKFSQKVPLFHHNTSTQKRTMHFLSSTVKWMLTNVSVLPSSRFWHHISHNICKWHSDVFCSLVSCIGFKMNTFLKV